MAESCAELHSEVLILSDTSDTTNPVSKRESCNQWHKILLNASLNQVNMLYYMQVFIPSED